MPRITGLALTLLCVCLAACNAKHEATATLQAQHKARAQLEEQEKIAAQTAQAYRAMDNAALLKKLAEQSARGKEPFNSLAYRELETRKDVSSDSLVALIHELKGGDALLPLLLLRRLDEKRYSQLPVELRANVLTDALEHSKTFNTWGLPGIYLEDASRALIECGKSADPALDRMLSDTRPAPVFGSQQYMVYLHYKFRVCDYALFFLEKMQGNRTFVMPVSVADRDALIKQVLK